MATAVVSGRIDAQLKEQVDVIIRLAGSNISEVINNVWMAIAQTGELPCAPSRMDELAQRRARIAEFEAWLDELPQPVAEFAGMSDDEILQTKGERYV